jgi:hypothetical protein
LGELKIIVTLSQDWCFSVEDSKDPENKVSWEEFAKCLSSDVLKRIGHQLDIAWYMQGRPEHDFQLKESEKKRLLKIMGVHKDDFGCFKNWVLLANSKHAADVL